MEEVLAQAYRPVLSRRTSVFSELPYKCMDVNIPVACTTGPGRALQVHGCKYSCCMYDRTRAGRSSFDCKLDLGKRDRHLHVQNNQLNRLHSYRDILKLNTQQSSISCHTPALDSHINKDIM